MSQSTLNWQKIYIDYSPKLLGICRRYIADLQAAEDIVQDSFMTAMQKNHQLKDELEIKMEKESQEYCVDELLANHVL